MVPGLKTDAIISFKHQNLKKIISVIQIQIYISKKENKQTNKQTNQKQRKNKNKNKTKQNKKVQTNKTKQKQSTSNLKSTNPDKACYFCLEIMR